MAANKDKIADNISGIPFVQDTKIIIVGFSDDCMAASDILRNMELELYAYASDDLPFVLNKNKSNMVFAEKYINSIDVQPVKVMDFYEAVRLTNAVFLYAAEHYRELLSATKLEENKHYFKINT